MKMKRTVALSVLLVAVLLGASQRLLAAQELASMREGVCLSVEYELKLKWQCAQAHQWLASMAVVKRGTWCKECACKVSLA